MVVVLAGIVVGSILARASLRYNGGNGQMVRQDIVSVVNGTGQIKPKTYVNIGATAFGRITHLYVKEGDHVKCRPAGCNGRKRAAGLLPLTPSTRPSPHRRPMLTPTLPPS